MKYFAERTEIFFLWRGRIWRLRKENSRYISSCRGAETECMPQSPFQHFTDFITCSAHSRLVSSARTLQSSVFTVHSTLCFKKNVVSSLRTQSLAVHYTRIESVVVLSFRTLLCVTHQLSLVFISLPHPQVVAKQAICYQNLYIGLVLAYSLCSYDFSIFYSEMR